MKMLSTSNCFYKNFMSKAAQVTGIIGGESAVQVYFKQKEKNSQRRMNEVAFPEMLLC
jgi:hypothetical protein